MQCDRYWALACPGLGVALTVALAGCTNGTGEQGSGNAGTGAVSVAARGGGAGVAAGGAGSAAVSGGHSNGGMTGSGAAPSSGGVAPIGGTGAGAPMNAGGASSAGSGGAPQATGGAGGTAVSGGTAGSAQTSGSGGAAAGGAAGSAAGGAAGKELFILFGQSNMSGFSPMPMGPWPSNERVTFMVQFDCARLDQSKDEWLPAEPPLHGCQWATNGLGLGLGDYFGAELAQAWPDARIGLIPNAIPGVTIDIFMKGGTPYQGLPDGYTSAYTLMVDRVKEAQKIGRVRAILFHQGESDWNKGMADTWLGKVTTLVADLRADLGLTESVPFIAGEIPPEGNYDGINVEVAKIPGTIPNSAVVSAEGTHVHDIAHFDAESAQLMGERYVQELLKLVDIP